MYREREIVKFLIVPKWVAESTLLVWLTNTFVWSEQGTKQVVD